jgi:Ca-activated chloride channel family protein
MLRKTVLFASFVLLAASAFAINVSVGQLDASRLLLTQSVDAYVSVTDNSGKPVDGLSQGSFTIAESSDGTNFQDIDKITGFKPKAAAASGITFLLVIDDSGSMYDTLAGKPTTEASQMRITHAKAAVR